MIRVLLRGGCSRDEQGRVVDPPSAGHYTSFEVRGWPLPAIPRIGETIALPDGSKDGQDVRVTEVIYRLDLDVEVWVGGWTGWDADSVADLFARANEHVNDQETTMPASNDELLKRKIRSLTGRLRNDVLAAARAGVDVTQSVAAIERELDTMEGKVARAQRAA